MIIFNILMLFVSTMHNAEYLTLDTIQCSNELHAFDTQGIVMFGVLLAVGRGLLGSREGSAWQ